MASSPAIAARPMRAFVELREAIHHQQENADANHTDLERKRRDRDHGHIKARQRHS